MANPSQRINVTELDFDQIKTNLIAYFTASNSPFKDWNYSGSGLNTLIDLLSHNTHYNAVLAHMAVNESFIDSAQLRQNVVSSAKLIGYTPNSYTAAKATVNISRQYSADTDSSTTIVIPAYTIFNTYINKVSYEFVNLDDILLTLSNGVYSGVANIYQGTLITTNIQINNLQSNNQYIINDKNIDISTLKVLVYPTGAGLFDVYNRFEQVANIDGSSQIYFISENYNGNYFISFGNGTTFGKVPDNLGVLQLSYLVTEGPIANGAGYGTTFTMNLFSDLKNTPQYNVITATDTNGNSLFATGGSYNESISSIKFNAPLNFIAQNRAVTADDYKAIIKRDFPAAQTIAVWGGEENDPPYYGQVFISIAKSNITPGILSQLSNEDRSQVLNILSGKKVLSILPQIVNYDYVDIILDVMFKYNKNQTTLSTIQMESAVRQTVIDFNSQYLQSFDGVFRHSLLSKTIDTSSPAILNSLVRVYVSKSFTIVAGSPTIFTLKYGIQLNPENDVVIINSSGWTYRGNTYYLGDIVNPTNANKRIIYSYSIASDGTQLVYNNNVGSIDISTGIVELDYLDADIDTTVYLDLIPASNDIASARNKLIQINTGRLSVYGEVDAIVVGGTSQSINYNTFKRDR